MSAGLSGEQTLPLLHRLWIYQAERFPLARTSLLLVVFTAASISVSAHLGGRTLPAWPAFATAFLVTLIIFFQLRACDEVKDAEDDRRFRPERPVPRGLVSLRLIVNLGIAGVPVAALVTVLFAPALIWPLALVWAWLAMMSFEFFAPDWLKARPFLYLVSHMAIMPLIDLFVTACEWLPRAGAPPPGLWLFLALSFVNGCVLEIGRKLYGRGNERPGVETYSALLGPGRAALAWSACALLAYGLLLGVGHAVQAFLPVAVVGTVALVATLACALRYARNPVGGTQKTVDAMAGLWVLVCYGAAGFAPLLAGGRM
ncbi:UbiA family prenyltransferase [Bosea psychrotolerans]|uniref:4-hydroxybenzoate polyprenyltransferase n=1 Tax=Bosea psychrotolerans TaxID=1871628 RepID=A0A2S4MF04_9HYPH|nr:UbiA family prenyltransferase [Bosea psychrotolerans]POR53338.1 4-hydroxybenzoate polyprenyltransferase [Bosea psychrotolerans]